VWVIEASWSASLVAILLLLVLLSCSSFWACFLGSTKWSYCCGKGGFVWVLFLSYSWCSRDGLVKWCCGGMGRDEWSVVVLLAEIFMYCYSCCLPWLTPHLWIWECAAWLFISLLEQVPTHGFIPPCGSDRLGVALILLISFLCDAKCVITCWAWVGFPN